MKIIVSGRNVEVTPTLKKYAEEKIGKFEKYLPITEATVTLSIQKYLHKAEVLLKSNGNIIQAEGVTEELYASIDEVVTKLERQVKKLKEKKLSHRKNEKTRDIASSEPIESADSQDADIEIIIDRVEYEMKPMPPDEAAMQLEIEEQDFYVFTNSETDQFNVIYRKANGNLGLVEPVVK